MERIKQLCTQYREVISYLIVGGLTTVVSLGVYYGCVLTFLDPQVALELQLANVLSWIAAVTFAYFTNRKYVFQSQNEQRLKEAVTFYVSRAGTLLIDMGCMYLTVTVMGMNDKLAKILVQVIVVILNYIISKLIVFKAQ